MPSVSRSTCPALIPSVMDLAELPRSCDTLACSSHKGSISPKPLMIPYNKHLICNANYKHRLRKLLMIT
ncbi:hypothetical protein BHE74_00026470 [Ensete ventricosum]|nr:hypothetical protein BHE74_00026470 [Ensete ventricosum]